MVYFFYPQFDTWRDTGGLIAFDFSCCLFTEVYAIKKCKEISERHDKKFGCLVIIKRLPEDKSVDRTFYRYYDFYPL